MRADKDINHQTSFKTQYHHATVNVIYAHNWITNELKKYLKPFDCTIQQYNVLRILKGANEPLSSLEIRHRMVEKMADTSRLVERLNTKGWVRREECCGDRRKVDVTISEEGLTFLDLTKDIDKFMESLFLDLSSEDTNHLNSILDKIRLKQRK